MFEELVNFSLQQVLTYASAGMIADKEGLLEELIRPKDGVVNQCIQEGVIVSSICCTFGVMEIRKTEAENLAPEPPKKHDQEFRAIVEQLTVQVKRIVKAERQSTICGSSIKRPNNR